MTDRLFRGASPDPAPAAEPEIKIPNTSGFQTIKTVDGYPIWYDTRVNKFTARYDTEDGRGGLTQRTTIAAVEQVIRDLRPKLSIDAIEIGYSPWYSNRRETVTVVDVREPKSRKPMFRTTMGSFNPHDDVYVATPDLLKTRNEILDAVAALNERWSNMRREAERLTPYLWNQMVSQKRIEERAAKDDGEVEL